MDGKAKHGYMWLFAKMQQATTLPVLDALFRNICIIAMSKVCVDQLGLFEPTSATEKVDTVVIRLQLVFSGGVCLSDQSAFASCPGWRAGPPTERGSFFWRLR